MITISPHKSIYPKLHKAFPKPPDAARRCLDKYIAALERMLFDALQRGQTPLQRKLNLYSLPLKQLAAEGGQIGPGRIRLHAWLKSQNLELVQKTWLLKNRYKSITYIGKMAPCNKPCNKPFCCII